VTNESGTEMTEVGGKQTLHEGFRWTESLPNWQGWVPSPENPQQEPWGEFSSDASRTAGIRSRSGSTGKVLPTGSGHGRIPLEPSAPNES